MDDSHDGLRYRLPTALLDACICGLGVVFIFFLSLSLTARSIAPLASIGWLGTCACIEDERRGRAVYIAYIEAQAGLVK